MVLGKEQRLGGVKSLNGLGRGDAEEGELGASRKWAVGSERLLREVYREEIEIDRHIVY